MKNLWRKIKGFCYNVEKLYRLSESVSFVDEGDTILFNGNLEAVKDVRAGVNMIYYYAYVRDERLQEKQQEEVLKMESPLLKPKNK
jgi:hypothetical protein